MPRLKANDEAGGEATNDNSEDSGGGFTSRDTALIAAILVVAISFVFWRVSGRSVFDCAELASTIVFALSGGLVALRMPNRNLLTICLASLFTAVGGGTVRDVASASLPFWVTAFEYIAMSLLVGLLLASLVDRVLDTAARVVDAADRFALGCFAVLGAEKAIALTEGAGMGAVSFAVLFAAFLTGAGGGLLRDLLVLRRLPTAIVSCYGIWAAIGGILHFALVTAGAPFDVSWPLTIITIFVATGATLDVRWSPVAEI